MRRINLLPVLLCAALLFFAAACSDGNANDPSADINQPPVSDPNQDKPSVDDNKQDPVTPVVKPEDNTNVGKDDTNNPPETPVLPVGNMNPLTGLYDGISDEALNHKPVAIMVGNSYAGLPQWGIGSADIIYEMIAEARMTRLMAIYQDYTKIEKISGIRSARPYFIDIAQSYGAIFVHFGASEPAVEQIALREDLIDIDGIKWPLEEIAFFRDPERKAELGSEHSVYTSGELLKLAIDRQQKSVDQSEHPSAFRFGDTSSAANGKPMSKVEVTYKSNHKPYFVYDEMSGEYLRYQYKEPHVDGLSGKQISIKNVLVLRMTLNDLDHYLDIVDIATTGSGSGYYFCEGKYIDITWEKASYNSPIKYYTSAGSELILEPGQTFVSVVTDTASVVIE